MYQNQQIPTEHSRILKPSTVTRHTMPWQALLVKARPKGSTKWPWAEPHNLICGGVIICPYFVLSAGHCSYEYIKHTETLIFNSTYSVNITYPVVVRRSRPADQNLMIGAHDLFKSIGQALFLCAPFLTKTGKCSPFLELTPTIWQMARDVKNISED